jgi:hypothetical protein
MYQNDILGIKIGNFGAKMYHLATLVTQQR